MSDTHVHRKNCRKARQAGLPPNIRVGSPCRKGQCRKVAARIKVLARKSRRAKAKTDFLKEEL